MGNGACIGWFLMFYYLFDLVCGTAAAAPMGWLLLDSIASWAIVLHPSLARFSWRKWWLLLLLLLGLDGRCNKIEVCARALDLAVSLVDFYGTYSCIVFGPVGRSRPSVCSQASRHN